MGSNPIGVNPVKYQRINLRIDLQTKELIERAAAVDHRSLTSFIIASAKQQAESLLVKEHILQLKKDEWDRFFESVDNPPSPNQALKKLMRTRVK